MTEECKWADYLKLAPIVYGFLIIISFLKLFIFYSFFGINISSYLELSEILVSFLDDIFFYILFLLYLCYLLVPPFLFKIAGKIYYYLISEIEKILKEENTKIAKRILGLVLILDIIFSRLFKEVESKSKSDSFLEKYFNITPFIIFAFLFFVLGINFISIEEKDIIGIFFIVLGIGHIIVTLPRILAYFKIKNAEIKGFLIVLFGELLIIIVILSLRNIQQIEKNKESLFSVIEYKNRTIESTDSTFFIGKTKNWIFYYEEAENKTTAFPLKDVGYIK